MLNRNSLFDAMSGISDDYLASAAVLLGDMKEDNLMHLDSSRKQARARKAGRILLIAAVLVCLFTVTAFAAGLFSISTRVPDAKETFQIHWDDSENGYLEWSDAKLVLTFPAVAESREIEFRPGWLPFDLPEELPGSSPWNGISKDTWFRRFASESLCWAENAGRYPEEYKEIGQPILIEAYSMAQFNDGGAMLMLYQTPENITEEHWDELGSSLQRGKGLDHRGLRPARHGHRPKGRGKPGDPGNRQHPDPGGLPEQISLHRRRRRLNESGISDLRCPIFENSFFEFSRF